MTAAPPSCWRTLKASVRGASHQRAGLPNQDAVRVARADGGSLLIAVLADGHGSAKSFRSQRGARLAVAVAQKVCRNLSRWDNLSQKKRWAEERLPLELVRTGASEWIGRWPVSPSPRQNWSRSIRPAAVKSKIGRISLTAQL